MAAVTGVWAAVAIWVADGIIWTILGYRLRAVYRMYRGR